MIVCAGANENFEFATPIGIGLIDSAINLTKICTQKLPVEIVFIGTCGIYQNGNIFDIFYSKNAANLEISAIQNISYTPFEQKIINDVSCETLVNSSNYITADKNISKKFAELGFIIENMEFYSVLAVAKKYKIPARGIFVATNFCDENAHSDFIKNHKKAKEILNELSIKLI